VESPLLVSILEALPADGGRDDLFSEVKEADAAMREGEMAFVKGDFAAAAGLYQRALQADPRLYEAALFAGDMYFKLNQNDKAAEWYARAIQINPQRETAYRYSATPFLRAGKLDEALSRYIEAVIAEPYNRLTWTGLGQWAEEAGVTLGHPRIEIPTGVTTLKDKKMTITVDPRMLEDDKDGTGTGAWMTYGLIRTAWATSEFARAYPDETAYRHTLKEEAAALNGVVQAIRERQKEKRIKLLDPSLQRLVKLADEGLLEPFILYALADQGIAQDYAEYRRLNRDKLRRYLLTYVAVKSDRIDPKVTGAGGGGP
jgi:tetratricopeptide (TPR) repeat protein